MVVVAKLHGAVGLAAAFFKESMRRAAMIGEMIAPALVDVGCRQPPRSRTIAEEGKLTLRARSGLVAENTIAISTALSNAPYTTHIPW